MKTRSRVGISQAALRKRAEPAAADGLPTAPAGFAGEALTPARQSRRSLRLIRPQGALAGVRVLDLTNVLAGPFCAYQLGLLGAEVIKLELPETGDLARQLGADATLNEQLMGASFLAQNGGKKSITVNLKSDGGRDVLRRLVRDADVLVENFRPGVMGRLGLGYEELAKVNPALIYCAISGYGQEGPLKDAPAYDQIIQGLSGVMSITGDENCAPLRVGYPIADTIGGITAAFSVASALVRRSATGKGAFIDVFDARLRDRDDGLGRVELSHRRPRADTDGERQLHGGPVRYVQDRRRVAQYRRQQAGAIQGARAGRRRERTRHRRALRRSRESKEKSRRADRRTRGGAAA
jgi:hypothetical protein